MLVEVEPESFLFFFESFFGFNRLCLAQTQMQMQIPIVVSARTRDPPIAMPIMVDELIPTLEGEVVLRNIGIEDLLVLSVTDGASGVW